MYREIPDDGNTTPGLDRLCMALKGEEEGKIILGAFSMMDYYLYFDRLDKKLKIYKENCYLRTRQILLKRERILETIPIIKNYGHKNFYICSIVGAFTGICWIISKRKKKNN